jgi:hypothetical protein
MLATFKSDESLLEKIRKAEARPLTREQLDRQTISFVYGNLPLDSTITRDQVAKRLGVVEGA